MTKTSYTIKYNRSSNHITGLAIRTEGGDFTYSKSHCSTVSGFGQLATGETHETVEAAYEAAQLSSDVTGRKLCKKCSAAAEAMIYN
jgi:hypothetical protein